MVEPLLLCSAENDLLLTAVQLRLSSWFDDCMIFAGVASTSDKLTCSSSQLLSDLAKNREVVQYAHYPAIFLNNSLLWQISLASASNTSHRRAELPS